MSISFKNQLECFASIILYIITINLSLLEPDQLIDASPPIVFSIKISKLTLTRNLHSVNGDVTDALQRLQNRLHLGGAHVLAFPPERVAGPILEVQIAKPVPVENVA